MLDRDIFLGLRRSREEAYFQKIELELLDKLRRRAGLKSAVARLGSFPADSEDEIVQALQDLGFTPDTVTAIYLVPPVRVAWSEGFVAPHSRETVIEAAWKRGIEEEGPAYKLLTTWLDHHPPESFFQKTFSILGKILSFLPPEERAARKKEIMEDCTRVASSSGGIMDLWLTLSDEKKAFLNTISSELD